MADIFVSYSRDDRQRVEILAHAFEQEGLSVWWDPNIPPGTDFFSVIDRELTSAKCAIVAWSQTSVKSMAVREEAYEALQRKILIPVWIDDVPLPRGFKLVQTEDLKTWNGDRTDDAWQRIMLQARAFTGTEEPAHTSPPKPQLQEPHFPTPDPPALAFAAVATRPQTRTAGSTTAFILTIIAASALVGMWIFGSAQSSGILTGTVGLAAFAFLLFRFAEHDLSPGMKAIATRWFLPVKGKVKVNTVEAFNNMFEAVFGPKHLSWKCLWRSALASTVALALLIAIIDFAFPDANFFSHLAGINPAGAVAIFFVFLVANVIGDYISLLETRWFLRLTVKRNWLLVPLIILDAMLTGAIFIAVTVSTFVFLDAYLNIVMGPKVLPGSAGLPVLFASMATAYVTSVWLWFALIFGPLARLFVWSSAGGRTAIGRLLDVQQKPFTALGYISALLILLIGAGAWGVTQFLA